MCPRPVDRLQGDTIQTPQTFFGEGLRVPHVKLSDAGKMRNDVWDLILSNLRTPLAQRGDMGAMLSALNGALNGAEPRLIELCQKYSLPMVNTLGREQHHP